MSARWLSSPTIAAEAPILVRRVEKQVDAGVTVVDAILLGLLDAPAKTPSNMIANATPSSGAGRFVAFLRDELKPWVRERYGGLGSAAEALHAAVGCYEPGSPEAGKKYPTLRSFRM